MGVLDASRGYLATFADGGALRAEARVGFPRRVPESGLDAWSAYHLGLDHMFRFNRTDNGQAASLFERALALNPHFSRALSGLSFTCFQDSFLQYSGRGDQMARE